MSRHDCNNFFLGWPQKIDFRPKNRIFGPQKGHFGQLGPRNGLPSGQTTTNQKTKDIQSYLRIWGTYDPIESGPSELKKWGFHRCSVKKCRILAKKWTRQLTRGPPYSEVTLDNFVFLVCGHLAAWQAVLWPQLPKVALLGSKNAVFGLKSIFCGQPKKNCYNHDGTPKWQPFCADCIAGWSLGDLLDPFWAQN